MLAPSKIGFDQTFGPCTWRIFSVVNSKMILRSDFLGSCAFSGIMHCTKFNVDKPSKFLSQVCQRQLRAWQ